jgi:23S rRNA (uridine2552-2'-O)-methyltransferase
MVVLDLGAAPGAWSQYARRRLGPSGRVVATDLLPMEPLAGVEFVQGDFREEAVAQQLKRIARGRGGGPAAVGHGAEFERNGRDRCPPGHVSGRTGARYGARGLETGRDALIKVLQGAGFEELVASARTRFWARQVPETEASRARSPETYLLASGMRMV